MNVDYMTKYERDDLIVFGVNHFLVIGESALVKVGEEVQFDDVKYIVEKIRHNPWITHKAEVFVKEI